MIGPSGSGKTTLLRCINLLEEYEHGTITIDGEPIGYRVDGRTGRRLRMSERDVAAARARIGMVFQSYNLFPHMSVLQNIVAAPVRVRGIERRQAASRAKLISWVTTTIVMPSLASCCIAAKTSPTSSGSSAEVISSNSMILGSIASARAIATRCC